MICGVLLRWEVGGFGLFGVLRLCSLCNIADAFGMSLRPVRSAVCKGPLADALAACRVDTAPEDSPLDGWLEHFLVSHCATCFDVTFREFQEKLQANTVTQQPPRTGPFVFALPFWELSNAEILRSGSGCEAK